MIRHDFTGFDKIQQDLTGVDRIQQDFLDEKEIRISGPEWTAAGGAAFSAGQCVNELHLVHCLVCPVRSEPTNLGTQDGKHADLVELQCSRHTMDTMCSVLLNVSGMQQKKYRFDLKI